MLNYQRVEQLIKLTLFKTAKPIWLWKEGRVPENLWLPFARPGLLTAHVYRWKHRKNKAWTSKI